MKVNGKIILSMAMDTSSGSKMGTHTVVSTSRVRNMALELIIGKMELVILANGKIIR
jgi:hypothetical protein